MFKINNIKYIIITLLFFSGCSFKMETKHQTKKEEENKQEIANEKFNNLITDLKIKEKIENNIIINFISCKEKKEKEKTLTFIINNVLQEKLIDNDIEFNLNKVNKEYNIECNYNIVDNTIIIFLNLMKNDVILGNSYYFYRKNNITKNFDDEFRTLNIIKENK